ncbi:MAG: hypothetical protein R3E10_03525 [Gemmatimonadota bacterium]
MFDLKPLSNDGVEAALKKAVRYRLLNEPFLAESICRDILAVAPDHQEALITLILSITDQFSIAGGSTLSDARVLLQHLTSEYDREYYAGIVCERKGKAYLHRLTAGTGPVAYDWLRQAMEHYEQAEKTRPQGNDDALLRWNTCARLIQKHPHVRPGEHSHVPHLLE